MSIPIFQVDAFTSRLFGGNPAAVCLLERWPEDALLQAIALENNLSETAFLVAKGQDYELRWFTPTTEIDLCGHATLGSGHVVLHELDRGRAEVAFHTRWKGTLIVRRAGDALEMDFPAYRLEHFGAVPRVLEGCVDQPIRAVAKGRDFIALLDDERAVREAKPDLARIAKLDGHGLIITAPGTKHDLVSRFFAPQVGVPEDPVTGSAHCALAPFWAERLGKRELSAFQASPRGGELGLRLVGERVFLRGHSKLFLRGQLEL